MSNRNDHGDEDYIDLNRVHEPAAFRYDAQGTLAEMRRAVLRRPRPGDADSIGRLRRLVARLSPEQYVTVRVDDLTALLQQAGHEET